MTWPSFAAIPDRDTTRRVYERLAAAETQLNKSVFLPAGNQIRDAAVEEYHAAKAEAAEWGVL